MTAAQREQARFRRRCGRTETVASEIEYVDPARHGLEAAHDPCACARVRTEQGKRIGVFTARERGELFRRCGLRTLPIAHAAVHYAGVAG